MEIGIGDYGLGFGDRGMGICIGIRDLRLGLGIRKY